MMRSAFHSLVSGLGFALTALALPVAADPESVRLLTPPSFVIQGSNSGLALADVNEDGHLDAVVGGGQLFVHLNDGQGNLPQSHLVPTASGAVYAIDLNGDQHPDIVTSQRYVLLGDGAGGFTLQPRLDGSIATSADFCDWDGDGDIDIVGTGGERIRVELGSGDGTFVSGNDRSLPGRSLGLVCADLGNDGVMDAIVITATQVQVHTENGQGGLTVGTIAYIEPGLSLNRGIGGEFGGSAGIELILSRDRSDGFLVLEEDGLGGFQLARTLGLVGTAEEMHTGDFDDDGQLDFVAVLDTGVLGIYPGDGSGQFPDPLFYAADLTGAQTQVLTTGDVTGDGVLDVVVSSNRATGTDTLNVLAGRGDGRLSVNPVSPPFQGQVSRVSKADFTQDGDPELVWFSSQGSRIFLFSRGASGAYELRQEISVPFSRPKTHVARITGDDIPDFARLSENDFVVVHVGTGNGLGARRSTALGRAAGTKDAIASADFDEDGFTDLAISHFNGNDLTLFFGDGTGHFPTLASFPILFRPVELLASDFNGDGHADLAVSRFQGDNDAAPSRASIYLGDGTGSLLLQQSLPAGGRMAVGDLNGDGALDLINEEIHLGDGSGSFTSTGVVPPEGFQLVVDLDRDGAPDLVGHTDHELLIHAGDGNGGVACILTRPVGVPSINQSIQAIHAVELDQDGQEDLVVLTRGMSDAPPMFVWNLLNRSFDTECLQGNVNATVGPIEDVLFVNGSAGTGPLRTIFVDPFAPFTLTMEAPSSKAGSGAPFALYAWPRRPTPLDERVAPFGLGTTCMATPLSQPDPGDRPVLIYNNFGFPGVLGVADRFSSPAPTVIEDLVSGTQRSGVFFLQGLICDTASPQGQVAVTNGLVVVSE